MNSKVLFIYNFKKLFEILNEIKKNLNFEIRFIDEKDYKNLNLNNFQNYLIIMNYSSNNIKNCLEVKKLPIKLSNLIEKINLSFLRNKFNHQ